ncbi:lytic polysaccharide monooxygenase [Actinoplanes oblitus]|uniref:Lytic polysaccharide monooxygenase n=1 Tax=Actinoplanes oblitus TaxID=3040509 RepID=A0ABY8WQZ9_9ACTN|nr:lytic polysaccharide monooxygenase [Actinoplanes oblitus]WIN00332.1 lytic polysaccharide monooxygenase [Actinoplanes oblitus]
MKIDKRSAATAAAVMLAPLAAVLVPSAPAAAHGWITSPPSRQDQCATGAVTGCGEIAYEPQSVEAPKGARTCSGGSGFTVLDNDNAGWKVSDIASTTAFTWRNTAAHRTLNWQYYVDGQLHQTISGNASQPPSTVSHTLTNLPAGRHKILSVWNIYDTANAFYACVDVNVGGGGGGPSTPPTSPSTPPSGNCVTAWSASAVYTGGATVSHAGHNWTARWWTQGEEPGTGGQWGVWQDKGAC